MNWDEEADIVLPGYALDAAFWYPTYFAAFGGERSTLKPVSWVTCWIENSVFMVELLTWSIFQVKSFSITLVWKDD